MNEDELRDELHAATDGIEPRSPSFAESVVPAGRRRKQARVLTAAAACVVVLAASFAVTALARDDEQALKTIDQPDTTSSTPSTTERPPSATTSSTSTESVPPSVSTTGATAPPTTPTLPVTPPRPVARPAMEGDIDGDGLVDPVAVEGVDGEQTTVRARLSVGGEQVVTVTSSGGLPPDTLAAVMGVTDVDGDGYAEVFLRVAAGASTVFGALLSLADDQLVQVDMAPDGAYDQFALHGSVTHLDSFACLEESPYLVLTSAVPADDELTTYEVTSTTVELIQGRFREIGTSVETRPATEVPDGVIACGTVVPSWG